MGKGLPHGTSPWPKVALGELLREPLRNGHSAAPSKDGTGIRALTLTAVTVGAFTEENTKFTAARPERVTDLWIQPGDIYIQRSNTPDLVGTARLYTGHPAFAIFPDLLIRIRLKSSVLPEYIAIYLQSADARSYFKKSAQGIAGSMPKISQGTIERLLIPLPPPAMQVSVVAAVETQLSRLDAAESRLIRTLANLKRARASVLKAAVEGRLVPTEAALARAEGRDYEPASVLLDRILAERKAATSRGRPLSGDHDSIQTEPERPWTAAEGWCWQTIGTLASDGARSLTDGPFGSNLKSEHYTAEGPRVVRLQNIGFGVFKDEAAHISEEHYKSLTGHAVYPRDLVLASLGEKLPRACMVPEWLGPAIVKADCIRFQPDHRRALPEYLNVALNSPPIQERTTAIIHGVGRPRLGLRGIREIPLPIPPLAEQHRIVAEVDRRLSVLDRLESRVQANLERCKRLRQAILKRAFEGRLVPQEPR